MKIAFYYHIPFSFCQYHIAVPGYFGVFIDSLASKVDLLYLILHESEKEPSDTADYVIQSNNIVLINLGLKTPAWYRSVFNKRIIQSIIKKTNTCDLIIIRSPTPLAPYFPKYVDNKKVVFMVVGDFGEESLHARPRSIREVLIWEYLKHHDRIFKASMNNVTLLVNSPKLFKKYQPLSKVIFQIKTTTLSKEDFYFRNDTCQSSTINLLYSGRVEQQKGVFELLDAVYELLQRSIKVELHIVGWESDGSKPVERALLRKAKHLNIVNSLIFHGKKSLGIELNSIYRMADIYIIPSYHEGFPRTIWEAMANSLPVIATRVGAIPEYLVDRESAIFIEPKQVTEIVEAVVLLVTNETLRKKMISNGLKIAACNTLEIQTSILVDHLTSLMHVNENTGNQL